MSTNQLCLIDMIAWVSYCQRLFRFAVLVIFVHSAMQAYKEKRKLSALSSFNVKSLILNMRNSYIMSAINNFLRYYHGPLLQ